MRKVARFFGGIDLHSNLIQVCIVDGGGQEVARKAFRGASLSSGMAAVRYLKRWRRTGRFTVEAMGMNRWFVDQCRAAGLDVVVVDPGKLNLKMLGKKTDRRDAHEMARRLMLGDIDRNATSYYPTATEYGARRVLRGRQHLVQVRQDVTNLIRSVFRAHREEIRGGSQVWGKRTLAWLQYCEVGTEEETLLVRELTKVLGSIQASIRTLTERVEAFGEDEPAVAELAAQSQIGIQTAATLVYELGDLSRFRNTRAVASYAGLVPMVSQSGDRSHHGKLTRRGNAQLRWILGQWALRLMAFHPLAKIWARPRLRRMHRNKVRTALARRLLVGVYVAQQRGETFSLGKCLTLA